MPIAPDLAGPLVRIGQERGTRRDEERRLIREAFGQGGSLREIARLTGLSHTHVSRIVEGDDSPDNDE